MPQRVISARFHRGLINIIMEMIVQLTERHKNPWQNRIALSGGVSGGLALGQAAVAAATVIKGRS